MKAISSAKSSVKILPFSPSHYPGFTRLWNDGYPDLERSELQLRLADLATTPSRWIAEQDGKVVGTVGYENLPAEQFHPHKFQLHLVVAAEMRCQGIGAQLYQHVIAELRTSAALLVRVWVRNDRNESLRFVQARGFEEEMQTQHSALNVNEFDLSRLEKYKERLSRYGYRLASFGELTKDPERNRKIYSLYYEVMQEIPSAEPPQLPTFAEYEERIRTTPEYFRAHFVAIHQGEYVGICILLPKDRERRELYADTLGVRRNSRGRGIAQALSYCGIEYAKTRGYASITADNFSENTGIIPLLDNLGFTNRTGWTLFSKSLQ